MFLRGIVLLLFAVFISFRPSMATAGEYGVVDFLPIGARVMSEAGMTPPKPFFISPFFFYMNDYLKITNASGNVPEFGPTQVGVQMSNASTEAFSPGIRAGFWLLPFLQIFGLYVYSDGYTTFTAKADPIAGILPNGYELTQKIKFKAQTGAIGINAAYGFKLGPVYPFGSLNANYAWTTANLVDEVLSSVIVSGRIGVNVPTPIPNMDVAVWIGAMYRVTLGMSSQVSGAYEVTIPKDNFAPGFGDAFGDRPLRSSYSATQSYLSPWSMVTGFGFNPCRYFGIMTEFGFIDKFTANVGLNFNF